MPKLRLKISISLDGFVAGPGQSAENPLGLGGMRLHEWVFPLKAWRQMHGMDGGEENESSAVVAEGLANIGATIMGRHMFGGHHEPPFHHPVFVLTHHARKPLRMKGGTTFHFVTGGIRDALDQATRAAGGQDVSLAGGANAAGQYLKAGLVDEMELHLAPVLLGAGERLFDGVGRDLHGLQLVRTIATPKVTHLKYARK